MESILSVQDEIYPLKTRRNKSSIYLSNHLHGKNNLSAAQPSEYLILFYYNSMKQIFLRRSIYILGILNLCLAALAIVCVTQAEDHPEYFALVYVAVGVFIFYMATIIFIIILQIVQTYRRQNDSSFVEIPDSIEPSSSTPIVVVQSRTKTHDQHQISKPRLSRSQTLPLRSLTINPLTSLSFSTSTSSSTLKESSPIRSNRHGLLSKSHLTKNYQTIVQKSLSSSINNHSDDPQLSPLIKPIPLRHSSNLSRS